jgi:hypothetical protein
MAGFEVTPYGGFCLTPEVHTLHAHLRTVYFTSPVPICLPSNNILKSKADERLIASRWSKPPADWQSFQSGRC